MNKNYKIELIDHYKGKTFCVVAMLFDGYRCGYVKIPENSIFYKKDYSEDINIKIKDKKNIKLEDKSFFSLLDWNGEGNRIDIILNVHGGVTFAGIPSWDNNWYIGFDCIHWDDARDPSIMNAVCYEVWGINQALLGTNQALLGTIKTTDFVVKECKRLIDQINYFESL